MQISTKKLPKSTIEIIIEADEKELQSARKQAIARLAKEVKIAGFRDGNAPEDEIIKKVGEEVVERETTDIAISLFYAEAVKKKT